MIDVTVDKLAQATYPIEEVIRRRWSPRAFDPRPVEPEKLLTLFEAARWAPSSFNEQPWRFLIATKQDAFAFERILLCLVEANQVWARRAPVLMLSMCSTMFAAKNTPNRHAWHDVGMSMMSLVLQASALDLFVHMMAGFDADKARETFAIPGDFQPVAAVAIGYLGDPQTLPPKLFDMELKPRQRKTLKDIVFFDRFGDPAPLVEREPGLSA
jgi:nitroreductase